MVWARRKWVCTWVSIKAEVWAHFGFYNAHVIVYIFVMQLYLRTAFPIRLRENKNNGCFEFIIILNQESVLNRIVSPRIEIKWFSDVCYKMQYTNKKKLYLSQAELTAFMNSSLRGVQWHKLQCFSNAPIRGATSGQVTKGTQATDKEWMLSNMHLQ